MGYLSRTPLHATRHVPQIRVSFHTDTRCYQVDAKLGGLGDMPDPNLQILTVNTQKSLQNPAGGFTVTLVGDTLIEVLKPNDIVVISMGYKGEGTPLDTVMVGLVDTIRRNLTAGDGQPSVTTTITGRDFGKLLIKSMLKFYPELMPIGADKAQLEKQKFFLTEVGWITLLDYFTGTGSNTKGSPAQMLDIIVRRILQKVVDTRWTAYIEKNGKPQKTSLKMANILRYQFAQTQFFSLPLYMSLQSYEGSIWNLMERGCPKPFTELFIDVRSNTEASNNSGKNRIVNETIEESSSPDKSKLLKDPYVSPAFSFGEDDAKVVLVMRNTPFNKNLWDKLVYHKLVRDDILSEDLAISDDEHYNLFWAGMQINPLVEDLKRVSPPTYSSENIKRYGLSPLEVTIDSMQVSEQTIGQDKPKIELLTKNLNKQLKTWFENNHLLWNGTMEVRGKGNYKIGQRLIREDLGREFYIEGVQQSFHVFTGWTTTLTVTRGAKIGKTPVFTEVSAPQKPVQVTKPNQTGATKSVASERYHVVQTGDSLWKISVKYYGVGTSWNRIWEENKNMLIKRDSRNAKTPGKYIYSGQKLRIPK